MANFHRCLLLSFVIFISVYLLRLRQFAVININKIKANQYLRVYGEICSFPQKKGDWQLFKVGSTWIKTENREQFLFRERLKIVGKPQVRVINKFYKQIWLINPEISKFNSLSKEEQKRFTPRGFISSVWGRGVFGFMDIIRRNSQIVYYRTLPEPHNGLLAGIVLGSNENLDWDFWQALKETGTLHIIAASGMNVTLVVKVIIDFLVNFIRRRSAYFVSIIAIFIYCFLAGGSPAVVRAGLMASFAFLGLAFGREATGGWLLFLAAGLMLLVNPFLIFDVGFQLSFTAMAGMIFLRPVLEGFLLASSPSSRTSWLISLFNSNFLDTLSAQIATMPILYFTFGQFQPLAFIPNLFVVPLVPTLMMIGFVTLVLGLIWLPLAYPVAWLAWLPLTFFVEVVKWWGKIL